MFNKPNSVSPRKSNERPAGPNISLFPRGKLTPLPPPPGIPAQTSSNFAQSSSSNAPRPLPGLSSSAPSPRVRASVPPPAKVLAPQSSSRHAETNPISRFYRSYVAGAAGAGQDRDGHGLSKCSSLRPTSTKGHGLHHGPPPAPPTPPPPTTANGHGPAGHQSTGHRHGVSHSHQPKAVVLRLSRGEPNAAASARSLTRTYSSVFAPKTPSPHQQQVSRSNSGLLSPSSPPSRASACACTHERGSSESNQGGGGGEPSPRQRLLTRTNSSTFASGEKPRQSSRPESNSITGSGLRVTGRQVMSKQQPMYKARHSQRSDHLPLLHKEDVPSAAAARTLTRGDASSRSSDSFGTPPLESFGASAGSLKPKSTHFPRLQPPLELLPNLSTTGDSSDIRSVSEDGQSLPPPVRTGAGFHFHTGLFWPIWSLISAFWNLYYWYKPPIPATTPTEPMTLIANERTFLGWQKCAVWMFILTRGTLWGASMQPVLTLFLLLSAFRNWNCRRAMLYYCIPMGMGRYDTVYLPCIVSLGVFAGIIIEAYRNSQTVVMSL